MTKRRFGTAPGPPLRTWTAACAVVVALTSCAAIEPIVPSGTTSPSPSPSTSLPGSVAASEVPSPSLATPTALLEGPEAFTSRETAPSCGSETVVNGDGWNLEGRRCLLDAFLAGQAAEFTSTADRSEGHVSTSYMRSLGAGAAEIWSHPSLDANQDRWLRMVGCSFHSVDGAAIEGTLNEPVMAPACYGPGSLDAPARLFSTMSVIPVGSLVRTALPSLRMREAPDASAAIVATLDVGTLLYVLDDLSVLPPVDAGGIAWYKVSTTDESAGEAPTRGWVAATDGLDRFLLPQPANCGDGTQLVGQMVIHLLPFERLACFGSSELTLEGDSIHGFGGIGFAGSFEPSWLVEQLNGIPILLEDGVFWVQVPPDVPVAYPIEDGVFLRITGSFDDPAAEECRIDPDGDLHTTNVEAGILHCREQFVISSFGAFPGFGDG